jgi:glycosyltransferase involved in cell wall biosynthesis
MTPSRPESSALRDSALPVPAPPRRRLHGAVLGAGRGSSRPRVAGKFFEVDGQKRYLRGVTYGPFRPDPEGVPYDRARTADDFARMFAEGVDTVRLYTTPPLWLLDSAAENGLLVMAGVAWEQHVAVLDDSARARRIVDGVRSQVGAVAGHPALFAWAVGNEIPAPIARWYGATRLSAFVQRLHAAAKDADPGALVTYVNYPTTEYLELGFLDFLCFNVFLEARDPFESYLARLQNIADERPLVLTEIGLDSASNGEQAQAAAIDWQVRSAFTAGCAGAFVFAWTDEWHRGGAEIEDWHFGVTDRRRDPKPALAALRGAYGEVPFAPPLDAPRVSVIICTYNGARTLDETCTAVSRLEYPDVEAIVVDDGSTDRSGEIAEAHGFRLIRTENNGLSSARNTGLEAATGEIVAYVDDDAAPDPHWLLYLVDTFVRSGCAAAGGPNLPVPADGLVADAVAAAPGNATHVLVSDREAEHIPGCNAAFRTDALRGIGGFDARFRVAGDDVDVCWRLLDGGEKIAYSPAAVVWHHRRGSVLGYLGQQRAYGRAEAMLERKWPERYSAGGHVTWSGRIYGSRAPRHLTGPLRWRVYHGVWGTALFQSLYEPARGDLNTVLLMPEAYLGIGCLAILVALGVLWPPLFLLAPLLVGAAGILSARAVSAAARASFPTAELTGPQLLVRRVLTGLLHLAQPFVRLEGRLRHGLTPWRRRGDRGRTLPVRHVLEHWSERWVDPPEWVRSFERALVADGAVVRRGSDFDAWDLETRGGTLAGVRVTTMVEEHGSGRQLARMRCTPTWSPAAIAIAVLMAAVAVVAGLSGAVAVAAILGVLAIALAARIVSEASSAMAATIRALAAGAPDASP